MTAQKIAEAGVALLPWLTNAVLHEGFYPVRMASDEMRVLIAALELLKPVADGTHSILPSAALETAENDALERAAERIENYREIESIAHDIKVGNFPRKADLSVKFAAAIRALKTPEKPHDQD